MKYNMELVNTIHNEIKFEFGSIQDELPEQIMSATFLTGNEKVLELGGNIGRNSMIISYILNKNNNHNYVVLETNTDDAAKLTHNRNINDLKFHIEPSALSNRPLIQSGWTTRISDHVPPGFFKVNTISWNDLNTKYNIEFDTLVVDCEGAFYYILEDFPEVLNQVKLVLMENDYFDIPHHKTIVQDTLKNKGFENIYTAPLNIPSMPYISDFYQAWKRV